MNKKILSLCIFITFFLPVDVKAGPDFTIVLFPDTQFETNVDGDARWSSMWNWVINNKDALNIKAVISEGDIVGKTTNYGNAIDGWDAIKASGLIYCPTMGNHDYDYGYDTTTWDTFFPLSYFSGKAWFGGAYNGQTSNYYVTFEIGSKKYMILVLEYLPRAAVISWAQGILDANSDRSVILETHAYMDSSAVRYPTGQNLWDKLIKINPQIFMVICGHNENAPWFAHREDENNSGKIVYQIELNYQANGGGGSGYMGLLTFQPNSNQILLTSYSDYLSAYDSEVNYSMPFAMCTGVCPDPPQYLHIE